MTKQLFLDLSQKTVRKKHGGYFARMMIAHLSASNCWLSSEYFQTQGLNNRACRLGRERANGRIISSQLGYRLLKYASQDEIREYLNTTQARIQALQEEYRKVMKRAHKVLNGEKN